MKKSSFLFLQKGFSLLEVIVALLIFSFIGLVIVQNVQSSVRAKKNLTPQMERSFRLRTVFLLLKKDITQAFNHRDFYIKTENEAIDEFKKQYRTNKKRQAKNFNELETSKDPIGTTFFKGEQSEFSLTTLNSLTHFSGVYPAQVSYSLESCKEGGKCLVRKEWLLALEEPSQGVKRKVLLKNIENLEFFYLQEGSDNKSDIWSSLEGVSRGTFPSAVEVIFETKSKEKFRWVISLRFTNNPQSSADNSQNPPAGTGTPPTGGSGR